MQIDPVRRRSNGTVDIDSYRRDALMLREQTRTEFFRSIARAVQPFIGGVAIIVAYFFALRLMFPMPAVAEVPEAIAARGEVLITTLHAVGAQVYECKAEFRRQTELAIPRTDCDAVHGREDGGAALRWPKLGNDRWQCGAWKGCRSIAGRKPKRHSAFETRRDAMAWRRTAQPHRNDSKAQHPRWCRQ